MITASKFSSTVILNKKSKQISFYQLHRSLKRIFSCCSFEAKTLITIKLNVIKQLEGIKSQSITCWDFSKSQGCRLD